MSRAWLDNVLSDRRTSKSGLYPTQVDGTPTPTARAIMARFGELLALCEANGYPVDYGSGERFAHHVYLDHAATLRGYEVEGAPGHDLSTLVIALADNQAGFVRSNITVMKVDG